MAQELLASDDENYEINCYGYLDVSEITTDEGASGEDSVIVTCTQSGGTSVDDDSWLGHKPYNHNMYYKPDKVTLKKGKSYKIYVEEHAPPEDNEEKWYKIVQATEITE